MVTDRRLKPGTRVRMRGEPVGLKLRESTGQVVRPDKLDGFYIVRLDAPAIYYDFPGEPQDLWEIREADINLDVIVRE